MTTRVWHETPQPWRLSEYRDYRPISSYAVIGDLHTAALAWACARNPDVVLAAIRAARSPREAAKILCYLISRGTQYVPGAGAEILKLVLEWPPDHIGYFWYALLGATELAVASYSGRFARWVEYNFVPDEVVNALARRQDLDEALLNGKQGTAAWLLRQRVLQKRASFIGDLPGAEFQ